MSGLWTLLVVQFALVYLSVLEIGLLIYGLDSDFKSPPPFLYFSLWLIVPAHFALGWWRRRAPRPGSRWGFGLALGASLLLSLIVARDLQLGTLDELSLWHALALTALAWASYFTARGAAARLEPRAAGEQLPWVLVILAAVWLTSAFYPFLPLGWLAAGCALGLIGLASDRGADAGPPDPVGRAVASRTGGLGGYLVLIAAFDLFAIAMDFELDTSWAPLWALALLAAGAGALWARTGRIPFVPHALGIGNFLLALWLDGWATTPWHAALLGLWLGTILFGLGSPGRLVGMGFPWALGGLFAYLFYGRLALLPQASWLVAPVLVVLAARIARGRRSAAGRPGGMDGSEPPTVSR